MSNSWFNGIFSNGSRTSSMDEILFTKVSDLVDKNRQTTPEKIATYVEGVRVVSTTNNGLIIPNTLPMSGTKGTVVKVRTASGEVTSFEGEIFVQWDGRSNIDRVATQYLKVASMKVSSLDNFIVLSGPSLSADFGSASNTTGELVHKSTKDLWTVKVGEDGSYEIERLFDQKGDPLKV